MLWVNEKNSWCKREISKGKVLKKARGWVEVKRKGANWETSWEEVKEGVEHSK